MSRRSRVERLEEAAAKERRARYEGMSAYELLELARAGDQLLLAELEGMSRHEFHEFWRLPFEGMSYHELIEFSADLRPELRDVILALTVDQVEHLAALPDGQHAPYLESLRDSGQLDTKNVK
jgi:hypothetical protein